MANDLIARLRGAYSTVFERSLAREAADVIESQQKRIAELESLQERNEGRVKSIVDEELLARIARMEKALQAADAMRDAATMHTPHIQRVCTVCETVNAIDAARAARAAKGAPGE